MLKLVAHNKDNKYGIPYLMVTTGIGYNVDKVKAAWQTRRSTAGI